MKTLIIKLGAKGDVVRTTSLLRALKGETCWATKEECIPLLPADTPLLKQIIDIRGADKALKNITFDLVLCLDDDLEGARLATLVSKNDLIGSYLDMGGRLNYTDSAREWFDMGLISKLGKQKADVLKKENTKTYQEIIFKMVNQSFSGQEYVLNFKAHPDIKDVATRDIVIGIEGRADSRWPTKKWNKFDELEQILLRDGFKVKFFAQRKTLPEYINDISSCDLIVTGDTLAMHLALALKINVVAIFTCTSPAEIYGYGRIQKIVSPTLEKAFYRQEYVPEAVNAVSLVSVYGAVMSFVGSGRRLCPMPR